eukprot:242439_1
MCNTIWQCCCFTTSIILITLYISVLLLDLHIENIIDSYHQRNIHDHCLSLIQNLNEDNLYNELHEIINEHNYHYHYYEKNNNKFNFNLLQNSICMKYYFKIIQQSASIDPVEEQEFNTTFYDNREIVHETYICDTDECHHCISYDSTLNSLKYTKCDVMSNNGSTNSTTPNQMRKESAEKVNHIKSEWSIYSENLSVFAEKIKTWQSELSHDTMTNIPKFNINDTKTFVYIENESCVEGTDCKYKKRCINFEEKRGKFENCSIQLNIMHRRGTLSNESQYKSNIIQIQSWDIWCKLLLILTVIMILYIVIHYESTTISEKYIWKTRAIHLSSQYNQQSICAICYEIFQSMTCKQQIILRCGHRFHSHCLNIWEMEQRKKCYQENIWLLQMIYIYIYRNKLLHKCPSCNRKYCVGYQKFSYQHEKYKDY